MWREDVMLDDRIGKSSDRDIEPMARKAALMAIVYAGAVLAIGPALALLGVSSRLWRGELVLILLWISHVDASSWRGGNKASSRTGRALCGARSLALRRPWILWMLALSPLASGMAALDWNAPEFSVVLARVYKGGLLWLFGLGMAGSWLSMLSPSRLARLEACPGGKAARAWAAVKSTSVDAVASMASWFLFCSVARWS